ncbi:hypothetical protein QQ056_17880 [Oscillatoria laete-virens NRMC-F 0139]|nr:hypothetical protein [Oscillatoria laete-virens]MDL5055403.1 hypothetical protein [Oscillatoria laete-virens NRMC-F 0139]
MEARAQLRQYLEDRAALLRKMRGHLGWKYTGIEELILSYGVEMSAIPLPVNVPPGRQKTCYHTCQQLSFSRKDLTYVEGYALCAEVDFAVEHAWLMNSKGEVIDPTWNPPGLAYLGIPLKTKWLKSILNSRKHPKTGEITNLSIFEGNYLEEFSLLKQGIPPEAIHTLAKQS